MSKDHSATKETPRERLPGEIPTAADFRLEKHVAEIRAMYEADDDLSKVEHLESIIEQWRQASENQELPFFFVPGGTFSKNLHGAIDEFRRSGGGEPTIEKKEEIIKDYINRWILNSRFLVAIETHGRAAIRMASTLNPPMDPDRLVKFLGGMNQKNAVGAKAFASELAWRASAVHAKTDQPPIVGQTESTHKDAPSSPSIGRSRVKIPGERALAAWRLSLATGARQQEIALLMQKKTGQITSQGQVSRWISQVEKFVQAGNALPDAPKVQGRAMSFDPNRIEIGRRDDRLTSRQRHRQSDEE